MTWHEETLEIANQPDDTQVRLKGTYSGGGTSHAVQIDVEIDSPTGSTILTLYTHTITGLAHETPTRDDVSERYRHKLHKVRDKILRTPYDQLPTLKPIR